MNLRHKIIREMIRQLPIPEARTILETNLPGREFAAIFYSRDVSGTHDLLSIADMLNTTESNVKKIRRAGYARLGRQFYRH